MMGKEKYKEREKHLRYEKFSDKHGEGSVMISAWLLVGLGH